MLQKTPTKHSKRRRLIPVGLAIGLAVAAGGVVSDVMPSQEAPVHQASGCAANHFMYGHNMASCSYDGSGLRRFAGTTVSGCVVGALGGPAGIFPGCVGGMVGLIAW